MYTNEKTPNEEIPDEVLNNFVNNKIILIEKKSENKNIDKKQIIKMLLQIFIVIFSLIPLIIDIIELIQRIQKNYETRISLVAQIACYILLIPFAINLYKHGDEEPDSCSNCLLCIGGLAGTGMIYTMITDLLYTFDKDGVQKYDDNSMKQINTSRIIFFVIAIVYDTVAGNILYKHF